MCRGDWAQKRAPLTPNFHQNPPASRRRSSALAAGSQRCVPPPNPSGADHATPGTGPNRHQGGESRPNNLRPLIGVDRGVDWWRARKFAPAFWTVLSHVAAPSVGAKRRCPAAKAGGGGQPTATDHRNVRGCQVLSSLDRGLYADIVIDRPGGKSRRPHSAWPGDGRRRRFRGRIKPKGLAALLSNCSDPSGSAPESTAALGRPRRSRARARAAAHKRATYANLCTHTQSEGGQEGVRGFWSALLSQARPKAPANHSGDFDSKNSGSRGGALRACFLGCGGAAAVGSFFLLC